MNVLLYGGGAVGLGIASCLAENHEVVVVARTATADELAASGLTRTGIFGEVHIPAGHIQAVSTIDTLLTTVFDCVLVCTKAFDTAAADRDLSRLANADATTYILFQNGWGNTETFAESLPWKNIFNARVITGFTRRAPSRTEVTVHADDIRIGHLDGIESRVVDQIAGSITAGGIPASPVGNIAAVLWAKMFFNCSLNSLGAVLEASYGQLADDPHSRALIDSIVDECFSVMEAAGFRTDWKSASEYLRHFYEALIPPTRNHFPSTLQDLEAGKRTEIDSLNGAVIDLAESLNIDVPFNKTVYGLVKYKESR